MSGDPKTRRPVERRGKPVPSFRAGHGTMRSGTLILLVLADFIVAVMMVVESARFVVSPDPGVKAGAMYVVLALTTGCALLMFVLALNASFVPLMTSQRARDVRLVMWTMGATGILTGVLTLGEEVQGIVMRLFVGAIAFVFIRVQEARLERARRSGALPPAESAEPQAGQRPKARQRRGGRKH
jgi:hypothetical protein